MRKILLITTGGTIACGDTSVGRTPVSTADTLLGRLDKLSDNCEISAVSPFSLDSTDMSPENWVTIACLVRENYDRFDGFVITHGTDTLGYGAAALSCLIQNSPKPIVLTGSMRPMEAEYTDAKANLSNALLFACDERSHGVAVVFGVWAFDGRRVSKIHTTALNAFESVNYPPIAYFDIRGMTFGEPVSKPDSERGVQFFDTLDKSVEAVYLIPGVVPHKAADNTRAVVVLGFGTGGIPCGCAEWFEELISRRIYVIMSTQVLRGGSNLSLYEVGSRLLCRPFVLDAGRMTAEYAVMRAMWALGETEHGDFEGFRKLFLAQ